MKIEHLAVVFVLIILPIDIVLGLYLDAQMNTIRNQAMYDSKLVDCVYDAMKVYQSNSIVDTENDVVTAKMENIEASANTFLSSLQTSFGLSGYKASVMQEYVPAVVYTMYDGYYIYSKFNNTLSQKVINPDINNTFKDMQTYEGIKSYVFYSCRYQRNKDKSNEDDFVITYSLDNYITIQGKIKGKYEYASGYLIDGIIKKGNNYEYDGVMYSDDGIFEGKHINSEEYIMDPYTNEVKRYEYTNINGTKYYIDIGRDEIFHIVNGSRVVQVKKENDQALYGEYSKAIRNNKDAFLYYKEAYEFTYKVRNTFNLKNLNASDAVYSEEGSIKKITEFGNYKIFGDETGSGKYIQDSDSAFNQHRKAVIRYTIETNLKAAIAGFSSYSDELEYAMPKISEEDWETVENNVSVIGFLQGLDIGTKKYNGYAAVANTLTSEYVDENSIYIIAGNQYYRANATDITEPITSAAYNLDFERHYIKINDTNTYYYPKLNSSGALYTGSYTSIVSQTAVDTKYDDMYKYMREKVTNNELKRAYYTILAKERYGSYKISHDTPQFDYYLSNYR